MPMLTVDGAHLHYQLHGPADAPAVVLAHGRGGNAASWWQQVPPLAEHYRVLTFDHRGFGRSISDTPTTMDSDRFVADLGAMLDDAGIRRATVVCQSMGGRTGLGFALRHPERVTAIALCGTTGGLYDARIAEIMAGFKPRPARIGGRDVFSVAPDYPERAPAMAFLYTQIQAFNTAMDYSRPANPTAAATRVDPAVLAGWTIPTLVLGGTEDQIVPPAVLEHVAKLAPGATLHLLRGAGHSTYFEDAAGFNAAVIPFIEKNAAG